MNRKYCVNTGSSRPYLASSTALTSSGMATEALTAMMSNGPPGTAFIEQKRNEGHGQQHADDPRQPNEDVTTHTQLLALPY